MAPSGLRLSNISELRLFFALSVLVSHTIQLAGFSRYDIWRHILSSEVAVQGFFILSGFLVLGSYARHPRQGDFYLRRLLRIYPGYAVAVLVFLALCLTEAASHAQLPTAAQVLRYLVSNLLLLNFLQPGLDGVFSGNAYHEINGALWTIKLEVMFYALVPLLYRIGRRWSFRTLGIGLIVIGLAWRPALALIEAALGHGLHPSLAYQLPGQLHFFGLGVLLCDASRQRSQAVGNLGVLLAAVAAALAIGDGRLAAQMLLLSSFIYAITRLPQWPTPFERHDLSYGVYLCHFPIIQLLIAFGLAGQGILVFLATTLGLASLYALASWRWIESPALRLAQARATTP
jgi:peptidoglycan/LPS O-acetylase OafA/YrhL